MSYYHRHAPYAGSARYRGFLLPKGCNCCPVSYTHLEALGVYLPLITTNCAVLGVALTNVQKEYGIFTGMVNGFATALGFTISIVILAGIREKLEYNDYPESFKGMPMVLVTAGLMAIAFCGFSGLL